MSRYYRLLLGLIFIASLIFRFYYVSDFHHAFTIDQARDLLEVRKVVVGHDPVFIGPITSLNGIFLGPFWFYLNVIPFVLGSGNPTSLAFFQVLLIHFGVAAFYLYFRKKDESYALWGSLLLLLSPRLFEAGTYSFNANTTPVFVLFSLLLLDGVLGKASKPHTFILGLISGLTLQLEAAFGILIFPLCLFWLIIKKASLRLFLIGFVITLAPQILFEIKHKFAMAKVFLTEFSGGSDILGESLGMTAKLADRGNHYLGALSAAFTFPSFVSLLFPAVIILIFFLYQKKKIDRNLYTFFLINLSLIAFSIVLYFIYPNRLKDWWSINFVIPYILIGALALSRLPRVALLLVILPALPFIMGKYEYRRDERSNDRGLLLNQVEVVDWVYQHADGKGFKTYVFTPAIYDYHYQYLFWWYGQKKYAYLPETLSYGEGVPEYVDNNPLYWKNTKPSDGQVFLIIESNKSLIDRETSWRANFNNLCVIEKVTVIGEIVIEKLNSCSTNL